LTIATVADSPSITSFNDAFGADEIKISELKNIADAFYGQLKVDLYQLFQNVVPERKPDLQILEFQRFDEYSKLVAAFTTEKAEVVYSFDKSPRKPTKEHIQIMLSENMKKWNQLIMNLHTEVSLTKSLDDPPRPYPILDTLLDPVIIESMMDASQPVPISMTPSSTSSSVPVSPPGEVQMKNSASDSMLYRFDTPNHSLHASSETQIPTGQVRSKSHETSLVNSVNHSGQTTPPSDEAHTGSNSSHNGEPNRTRSTKKSRMGFGFRNAGKNPAILAQFVLPTSVTTSYSLDSDNLSSPPSPISSPSSASSSSATSPVNHANYSASSTVNHITNTNYSTPLSLHHRVTNHESKLTSTTEEVT